MQHARQVDTQKALEALSASRRSFMDHLRTEGRPGALAFYEHLLSPAPSLLAVVPRARRVRSAK